jgi:hypothetical protein
MTDYVFMSLEEWVQHNPEICGPMQDKCDVCKFNDCPDNCPTLGRLREAYWKQRVVDEEKLKGEL